MATEPAPTAPAPVPFPKDGLEVAKSAITLRLKAQSRIIIAGLAGALVGKHILPAELANDTTIDAVAALLFYGVASVWQDRRAILTHARLWFFAKSKKVSNDIIRPAPEVSK